MPPSTAPGDGNTSPIRLDMLAVLAIAGDQGDDSDGVVALVVEGPQSELV